LEFVGDSFAHSSYAAAVHKHSVLTNPGEKQGRVAGQLSMYSFFRHFAILRFLTPSARNSARTGIRNDKSRGEPGKRGRAEKMLHLKTKYCSARPLFHLPKAICHSEEVKRLRNLTLSIR
jgi:hypothetical protein